MNLQQLETFRLVAELGSFTRAARTLNSTQSTVSMRIAQLERELDVQLLDRSKRAVRLTSYGRNLLRYADDFHQLTIDLRRNISNPETLSGVIRIGVAELIALTWLPELVAELNRQYPKLEIEIEVGLSGSMHERVHNAKIDVCLHPATEPPAPGLKTTLLGKVRFAFMASPRLKLPDRRLRPEDLAKWPLISLGPDSVLAEIQERWFARSGLRIVNLKRSNSMEVSAGLVRSGLGISLLPAAYYADEARADGLEVLDVTPRPVPVSFFAVRNANDSSPLVLKIIEIARDVGRFDA